MTTKNALTAAALALGVLRPLPAFAAQPPADPFAAAVAQTASPDPATRNRGADALGSFRRPESRDTLAALLSGDKDARVRQTAATSLGLVADRAALSPLVNALKDPSAPVRFAAVRSLGVLRAPAAAPLAGLLKDPDPAMRRTAAVALGQLADPATREALKGVLTDADEVARVEAAVALARMGDASGLSVAHAGLKSRDAHARRSAAVAAALAGDSTSTAALDAAARAEKDPATKASLEEARAGLRGRLNPKKPAGPGPKKPSAAAQN